MKRTVQMARAGIPTAKGTKRKVGGSASSWDPGPVVAYGQVRRVGQFFPQLNSIGKNMAKVFSYKAHAMTKPEIDKEFYRLEQMAKYNNFDMVPKR